VSSFLAKLGVATDYRQYGIDEEEFRELVDLAFDGERGQNFIGSKGNLLAAAGLGAEERKAVA